MLTINHDAVIPPSPLPYADIVNIQLGNSSKSVVIIIISFIFRIFSFCTYFHLIFLSQYVELQLQEYILRGIPVIFGMTMVVFKLTQYWHKLSAVSSFNLKILVSVSATNAPVLVKPCYTCSICLRHTNHLQVCL